MAIKTRTMITIQTQVDTVILSLEAWRLYGGPTVFATAGGRAQNAWPAAGLEPSCTSSASPPPAVQGEAKTIQSSGARWLIRTCPLKRALAHDLAPVLLGRGLCGEVKREVCGGTHTPVGALR
jgi:hypothetical protein